MNLTTSQSPVCCFKGCKRDQAPSLSLDISVPWDDSDCVVAWAHDECFTNLRHASIRPDDPSEHGHIPVKACCVFCGRQLPTIGRHPYCLEVGHFSPSHRFWAHAECLLDRLLPSVAEKLTFA